MYGVSEKMFRATGHSDGRAKKRRELSIPLPALTNLYMVFIKMSLDERKSFPRFKVTILSIKLWHNTGPATPFCTQRQLWITTLTCSLAWRLVYFLLVKRCGFESLQEINLTTSCGSHISNPYSPTGAGPCRATGFVVSTWHPHSHILRVLLRTNLKVFPVCG